MKTWCTSRPHLFHRAPYVRLGCDTVTDVDDSAYIVGGTGRVVATAAMAGLAHTIAGLLQVPTAERLALGAAARFPEATHFEIDHITQQFEVFYAKLESAIRAEHRSR